MPEDPRVNLAISQRDDKPGVQHLGILKFGGASRKRSIAVTPVTARRVGAEVDRINSPGGLEFAPNLADKPLGRGAPLSLRSAE